MKDNEHQLAPYVAQFCNMPIERLRDILHKCFTGWYAEGADLENIPYLAKYASMELINRVTMEMP